MSAVYLKKYLAVFYYTLLALTFAVLVIDPIKSGSQIWNILPVDPIDLIIIMFSFTLIIKVAELFKIDNELVALNLFFIFPMTALLSIFLTFLEHFTYPNFVYQKLLIHYDRLTLLALASGVFLVINLRKNFLLKHLYYFIYYLPLCFVFLMILVRLWPNDVFLVMVKEDHLIENSQVVALLIGSVMAALLTKNFLRKKNLFLSLVFLAVAVGLFFTAGEEISWGQRIFGLATPESLVSQNTQGELTVHNLKPVVSKLGLAYLVVSLIGMFAWLIEKPLIKVFKSRDLRFLIPQKYLFFFFAFPVFYYIYTFLGGESFSEWSEPVELLLYSGVMFMLITNYIRLKNIDLGKFE